MAKTFASAATRAAYVIDPVYEANRPIYFLQLDTGMIYRPIRGGAAAENWEEVFYREAGDTGAGGLAFMRGIPLYDLREVTSGGDVANIAGIGGVLASDTTPVLLGDAAESQSVLWATGNADLVAWTLDLPTNFDGASNVTVEMDILMSGATNTPAGTLESGWDGGALVSDTMAGGAASASIQTLTGTIAAADIPNTAKRVTFMYTPAAHANDTLSLYAIRVKGAVTITG